MPYKPTQANTTRLYSKEMSRLVRTLLHNFSSFKKKVAAYKQRLPILIQKAETNMLITYFNQNRDMPYKSQVWNEPIKHQTNALHPVSSTHNQPGEPEVHPSHTFPDQNSTVYKQRSS